MSRNDLTDSLTDFEREYLRMKGSGQPLGGPLPYGCLARRDRKAFTCRTVRKTDPCTWQQVFKRITRDVVSGKVLFDEHVADQLADYNWHARLESAPRSIQTVLFRNSTTLALKFLNSDSQDPYLVLQPYQYLNYHQKKNNNDINSHTHPTPLGSHCVKGKARGLLHRRQDSSDIASSLVECDYTFWSHKGYELHDEEFLIRLNVHHIHLWGDAEHPLQAFLRATAARVRQQGLTAEVTSAPKASHASTGGAEKAHDVLASFVRTFASVIEDRLGVE
eukprot:5919818-Amphidinium_carterae.1